MLKQKRLGIGNLEKGPLISQRRTRKPRLMSVYQRGAHGWRFERKIVKGSREFI